MFGINEAIIVVPAEPNDAENAPDYRVHLDEEAGPEIGAGWTRVGEKAGDYMSIEIDSEIFAGPPLRTNLFRARDEGHVFNPSWTRTRTAKHRSTPEQRARTLP